MVATPPGSGAPPPPVAVSRVPTIARGDAAALDLAALRGDASRPPDASIVIPVNAAADLDRVRTPLADLSRYRGANGFEVVLVVNNFAPDQPPDAAVDRLRSAGATVVSLPSAWRPGEAVCLSARVPGIRAAGSDRIVLLDADVRVPHPTALLDWYVDRLGNGAGVAYTRVDFLDLRPLLSVRVKVLAHHLARAAKRRLLRLPTTRGSSYGVLRPAFLAAYDADLLSDDLNVGPTLRRGGAGVAYSGATRHRVLTSGRTFHGGWRRLYRQLRYRLLYNLRMVPVRAKLDRHPYHDRNLR